MILPFEFAPKAKRATCVSAYDFFVDRGRGDLAILESYTTFGWFPVCRAMCASMRSPRDLRCEISDVPARIKVEGVSALIFEQMQGISIETTTESSFRVKIRRPPREEGLLGDFSFRDCAPSPTEAKGLVTPMDSLVDNFTFSAPSYPGVIETVPTSSCTAEVEVFDVPGAPDRHVEPVVGHGARGILLHELLDHAELFESAPFLRDVPVFFSLMLDACGRASKKAGITLGVEALRSPNFFRDTLLHEVQHMVQFHTAVDPCIPVPRKSAAPSFHPKMGQAESEQAACDRKVFKRRLQRMLSDRNTRFLVRQYDALRLRVMESAGGYGPGGKVMSPPDISAILALARFEHDHPRVNWYVIRMLRSMASGDLNFKIAGRMESKIKRFSAWIEVEARVIERRQYLTVEEMVAQSPWDTADLLSFPVGS